MKKHIFGIALFCSIVASFALVFAFIYAPVIPQIEEVKQVETKYEMPGIKPYSCKMKREKVSFEVLSSEYFYDENKIVTRIKLKTNNEFYKPEKVYINYSYSNPDNVADYFSAKKEIENPFADTNENVVEINHSMVLDKVFDRKQNLYVLVDVTENDISSSNNSENVLPQTKAVLFVHGKSSIIKK